MSYIFLCTASLKNAKFVVSYTYVKVLPESCHTDEVYTLKASIFCLPFYRCFSLLFCFAFLRFRFIHKMDNFTNMQLVFYILRT